MSRMDFITLMFAVSVFTTSCLQEKTDDQIIPGGSQTVPTDYNALADSLQNATYSTFLSSNGKYYVKDNTGDPAFNYWWNAHALDALVDAYERTGDSKYVGRMKALISGMKDTNGGTFLNDFYDDMEWLALASLRAYHATDDNEFLDLTKLLWTDIKTGLNANQGGGIAWRKSQLDYKNTPANAPAIILACRLYKLEGAGEDLELAKSLYSWLKTTLLDQATGIIWDGINRNKDGQIDKWLFTYNQGVYMGAGLELYNVTNEQVYLNDAIRNADYVSNDSQFLPGGIMKEEGGGDGGLFKGILVRYLTVMSNASSVPQAKREKYKGVIAFNAKTLAEDGIKRPSMLIGQDWRKAPVSKTDFSTQLSGVMLIEAMASLDNND